MDINEVSFSKKKAALVAEVSSLDEDGVNSMLIEFFGWTDKENEDSEKYDLETDTKE